MNGGASPVLLVLGVLLVATAYVADRPASVLFAVTGVLVLLPETGRAFRAWRQTRQTSGEPR